MENKLPEIRGVVFLQGPLFQDGIFGVYSGYIETETRKGDIAHYLIVNQKFNVVEGSTAKLFEARGECSFLNAQLSHQDSLIDKGDKLYDELPNGANQEWKLN